ncbi:MAG: hypothetical protein P1V81_08640 [Planctomycetota bacterium]|nr:hypothetical protein [Planctomycetota bacterium]
MKVLLGSLLVAALAATAPAQSTLPVPGSFASIQAAVDAASSGDTILVAPGHYNVSTISIIGKDVLIMSSHGARETDIFVGTPGRCFFLSGTTTTGPQPMTIEGFTIANGKAPSAPPGSTGQAGGSGGAILVDNGGVVVRGCIFDGNRAGDGSQGVEGVDGAPLSIGGLPGLPGGKGGAGGHGGAIAILQNGGFTSPSSIEGCQFFDNRSGDGGPGGTGGRGGDDIRGVFSGSDPGGQGGPGGKGGEGGSGAAIFSAAGSSLSITNCTIRSNTLGSGGLFGFGGQGGSGSPSGATGTQGSPGDTGLAGGVYTSFGAVTMLHCTAYFNDSYALFAPPPGIFAPSFFQNSIAVSNQASPDVSNNVLSSYSNIQGGAGGTNIDVTPGFAFTELGDLHLHPGSACIDAGDAGLTGPLAFDRDGDPRILGGVPDMGSDEDFQLVGTDEDFVLLVQVGPSHVNQTPGLDVQAGDFVTSTMFSPNQTFTGNPMLYALQPYASGPPMGVNPTLPGSVMDTTQPGVALFGFGGGPLGPVVLPPGGQDVAFVIPPGLTGITVRLQGYVISPLAGNGVWAGTDGRDLRIQ